MDDHSDGLRRLKSAPRVEIFTGSGRRRWDDALKARIVAESLEPGAVVTEVARRHGCRPQQVHDWRRLARRGLIDTPGAAPTALRMRAEASPQFVPLIAEVGVAQRSSVGPLERRPSHDGEVTRPSIECAAPQGDAARQTTSPERGVLTIEIEDAVVHVRDRSGLALLTEVFTALRQARQIADERREGRGPRSRLC